MYTIDNSTENTFVSFTGGIQDNVVMVDARFEPADKEGVKEKVLRFFFKGPLGQRHIETIFPINAVNTTNQAKAWGKDAKQMLNDEYSALAGKVQHILQAYIPKEKTFTSGSNWEEFCTGVLTALGKSYVGVPVAVKLVYNSKDYLGFPRRAVNPFIARMADKAKITINPKYDKIVASAKKEVVADPFAIPAYGTAEVTAGQPVVVGDGKIAPNAGFEKSATADPFVF